MIKQFDFPKLECLVCGDIIFSKQGGNFVSCKCGATHMDRDRWMPERIRFCGDSEKYRVIDENSIHTNMAL
jgi:hypothetical protein